MKVIFLILTVIAVNGALGDPIGDLTTLARQKVTTFLTADQIKSFIKKVCDEAWQKKTASEIARALIPWAMTKITPIQMMDVMNTLNTASNQCGGMNKTWDVIYMVIDEGCIFIEPYQNEIYQMWDKMRATSTQQQSCDAAYNKVISYATNENINKLITAVKTKANKKTCELAYKYLNKKYLLVDQYGFVASQCAGTIGC